MGVLAGEVSQTGTCGAEEGGYPAGMSFNEVLAELPKLSPQERDAVRIKLAELNGEEWMDDGLLTPEDKALIERRVAEHAQNPDAAIPWAVMEARLKARYGP